FVVKLGDQILAKIPQRYFRTESNVQLPHLVGPLLEFRVVRHTSFERNSGKLRPSRRLASAARVSAFAVFHYFRPELEYDELADADNVPAVPFHAELEILIGIESLRVYVELGHVVLLRLECRQQSAVSE